MFPIAPSLTEFLFFILIIFPGLVSMHTYRLLMPARDINWATALIEALFWGTFNFAICLPLIMFIHRDGFADTHFWWYVCLLIIVLLLVPLSLPFCLRWFFASNLGRRLQLPYPTAWDYFFFKRKTCYVIVHLKNEQLIGGYFGGDSYATSFPRHGDIYLEKVITVDSTGKFGKMVKGSAGTVIPRDAYVYLELFCEPEEEGCVE